MSLREALAGYKGKKGKKKLHAVIEALEEAASSDHDDEPGKKYSISEILIL